MENISKSISPLQTKEKKLPKRFTPYLTNCKIKQKYQRSIYSRSITPKQNNISMPLPSIDFIQKNKMEVKLQSEINKTTRVVQPYFRRRGEPKRDFYLELRKIRLNSLKKYRVEKEVD